MQQRLNVLNRAFYEAHAEVFADTRPRLAEGIQRVLATLRPGASILEVGCGDGKVARWLARKDQLERYVGLDFSAAMLARAERYTQALAEAENLDPRVMQKIQFLQVDLAQADWAQKLHGEQFDYILAFAVLHHLPGAALRAAVVRAWAGLLRPNGRIVMSNWQVTRSPRLERLLQPWRVLGLSAPPEVGDYLLRWERGGQTGLRYVHLLPEAEAHALAAQAGLTVTDIFQADGHSGRLTDYVTLGQA